MIFESPFFYHDWHDLIHLLSICSHPLLIVNQPYLALSRKYRPKTFGQVIGQDSTAISLQNALKESRISHAYLFSGTRGCGKTTIARIFAKALTCIGQKSGVDPCNTCDSCKAIDQSRSMDVVEIDGASHRGIDDIRQLRESANYNPSGGTWKIYIIDEVHMLTKEAFNALLKTLEEPPPKVLFMLATTELHKVPLTIQSRCQRFSLNSVKVDLIEEKLQAIVKECDVSHDDEALGLIATAAEGSMRDAESLLDQVLCLSGKTLQAAHVRAALGIVETDWFFKLDACVKSEDLKEVFDLAKELLSSGIDLNNASLQLTKHFRNHLLLQIFKDQSRVQDLLQLPLSLINAYQKRDEIYTKEQCLIILDLIKQHQRSFKTQGYSQVHLEMMLIEIARSSERISWQSMWNELQKIQKGIEEKQVPVGEQFKDLEKEEGSRPSDLPSDPPKKGEPNSDPQQFQPASAPNPTPKKPEEKSTVKLPSSAQRSKEDKAVKSTSPSQNPLSSSRRDTLLHFAKVEFGGLFEIEEI